MLQTMTMSQHDRERLQHAKRLLEHPSFAARVTDLVGLPAEKVVGLLPAKLRATIQSVTSKALMHALTGALATLDQEPFVRASPNLHKWLGVASGAAGGWFGLPALALELPVSTTLMLRSIADVARSHGEDLHSIEARLSCLEVFALGGPSSADDASDTGYFAVRAALARSVSDAAKYLAGSGLVDEGAPALVRLVSKLAARFSLPVSEKAAAQALPVIGALGGAGLNLMFLSHFQSISEGHFCVRELERKYGKELVQREYAALD